MPADGVSDVHAHMTGAANTRGSCVGRRARGHSAPINWSTRNGSRRRNRTVVTTVGDETTPISDYPV